MKLCLIVDNSHEMRDAAYGYLKDRDFMVKEAVDGDEAMSVCDETMPDVILLDESAYEPRGGASFLKRLVRRSSGDGPVVIFCSGDSDASQMGAAILEGASECLVKPFDNELLDFKLAQAGVREDAA